MFFNKQIFIFISCFFLISCGLEIGEKAPGAIDFNLPEQSGICSKLGDYKQVFLDYFLKDKPMGKKVSQALACISFKIKEIKSLIQHEYLNKGQVINILNQDFIKKSYMEKAVDNILNPDYFYNYLSIKHNLVNLVEPEVERDHLRADWICQINPNNDNIISKKSADILVNFLEQISELFFSAEEDAYYLFYDFFDDRFMGNFQLKMSQKDLIDFSSLLSDYLSDIFPSYSHFLKGEIKKSLQEESVKITGYEEDFSYMTIGRAERIESPIQKAMAPLLESLKLPFFSKGNIRPQNLKYLMLNIYIMKNIFEAYDINNDFVLSSKELKSLSCFIAPIISTLASSKLKGEWELIKEAYDPTAISNYIINYKSLPPVDKSFKILFKRNSWRFLWFRLTKHDQLYDQSYTELSQLISLFFIEFFHKIQFEQP